MHPFELKIMEFMRTVSKQSVAIDDLLLKPASKDVEHYIRKLYEDDPNKPFTLRMSNLGRPLCQLQMDKNRAQRVEDDWNLPLRLMYGGVVEGLAVSILKHSGIKVDEEQTKVSLKLAGVYIKGTLDLVLEGKVWDIKSASPYSFENKFKSYETLAEGDSFGYLTQLYAYAKARDLPPGGFIAVDKSSGEIKVLEVCENWQEESDKYLQKAAETVKILLSNATFQRSFTDIEEKFRKRFTGNRVLQSPCIFCPFRYSCWPGLEYLPVEDSTAYDKPRKYYTQHENRQLQSQGTQSSEENSTNDIRSIPCIGGT